MVLSDKSTQFRSKAVVKMQSADPIGAQRNCYSCTVMKSITCVPLKELKL